MFEGCVINSGDDGVQQSQQPAYDPYYLNALNSPTYGFIASTWAERWIGCDITTTGTGRACAIAVNALSNGNPLTCSNNAAMTSPASVQFSESALTSVLVSAGLSLAALNQSAAPWVALFDYATYGPGYKVVNAGNLYTLVSTTGDGMSGNTGGPTTMGSSITDGSCTWSYTSAGETIYIYDNALKYTAPGAYVTGYTSGEGNVVVTASAPTGYGGTNTAPFLDYPSSTTFVFLVANELAIASPPMVLNNSVDIQFERCTFRSVTTCVATVQNTDSFGTARAAFHGCTFDGSWSLDVKPSSNPMMYVWGNPINNGGGCRVTVDECRFYSPAIAAFEASGGNSYINISRSELYPPNELGGGSTANVLIGGTAQLDFVENTVWGTQYNTPSYTAGVVTLGNSPTTYLGLAQSQTTNNARIIGNRFLGLYYSASVAIPGLLVDYADNVLINNNTFGAAANALPNDVVGIAVTSNAANVISAGNIFSSCPIAYSGTLAQLNINGNEIYDVGGSGYVPPPAPSYPGFSLPLVSWTPSLSCQTNPSNLTTTYTSQVGNIVRLPLPGGKYLNTVQFSLSGTTTYTTGGGGASGSLYIEGLPYTNALNVAQNLGFGAPLSKIVWAASGTPVWSINASGTTLQWLILESNATPPSQAITSITSGGTFTLSGQGSYISSN